MVKNCAVAGCGHRSNRDSEFRFFRFPSVQTRQRQVEASRVERRSRWISSLHRADITESKIKNFFICSSHFITGEPSSDPEHIDYVPSQDMGYPKKSGGLQLSRHNRLVDRKETIETMKITKKRKYVDANNVKVEVKEENTGGNDYLMAKGRLNSVLKQLTEQSDSDSSSDENSCKKKRRKDNPPAPYLHTYVMKLFDRSVDLAQFEEDTPLYPICRAWMKNQPRNPLAVVKRRVSSPEHHSWNGNYSDINRLPPPSEEFQKRIPTPLACQEQNKDNINLNYDEAPPVPQNVLIKDHLQRWAKVRKHWNETAAKNESRYAVSTQILKTLYNRTRDEMEV